MSTLFLIGAILMITGLFILSDISPIEIIIDIENRIYNRKLTVYDKVQSIENKKISKLRLLIKEVKIILQTTNRGDKFTLLIIMSLLSSVVGIFIGTYFNNQFLVIILGGGFTLIPFWYIKLIATFWKKELNSELETSLSLITSSYMRTEKIIVAIEENIDFIGSPLKEVFQEFLYNTGFINSNTKKALTNLKYKVDNDVFKEWIDALVLCQDNKNLKSTLPPITSKLSDMRIVSAKLDNLVYEPVREFFSLVAILLLSLPIIKAIGQSMYDLLMNTLVGKFTIGFATILLFIAIAGVINAAKPIEYKR